MIKTETVTINGVVFTRTYSDSGMMIRGGEPAGEYAEALDPINSGRTYTETDIPIEDDTDAAALLAIIMGDES